MLRLCVVFIYLSYGVKTGRKSNIFNVFVKYNPSSALQIHECIIDAL